MKIVIDSNIIIAAYAAHGLCAEIFEVCLNDHEIFICDVLIEEVKNGLLKKIKVPESIVKEIIELIKSRARIVEPQQLNFQICRDPKDVMVIGTAVKSSADLILTNDKALLVLKKYKEIKILNIRQFWELLRTQPF
ncbi:MAG: putative toxin-antitoxin system toxin component, PIN family [Elusimicrobiota bacterium]